MNPRYFIYLAIALVGLIYLLYIGSPRRSGARIDTHNRTPITYVLALIASVATAFWLGRLPNPMASVTRFYKAAVGIYPDILPHAAALAFFIVLAIIGNKLICGWACPLGALQELIHSIPGVERLPKLRPRFAITNSIRAALLVLMIVVPVGAIGGRFAVTYKLVNAFNIFDMRLPTFTVFIIILATMASSPFLYRPFCRFVCPFGLISWIAERISVFRVRVDRSACTRCGECIRACPLGAARDIVEGKTFGEDCFSCTRCIGRCPQGALTYGLSFRRLNRSGR